MAIFAQIEIDVYIVRLIHPQMTIFANLEKHIPTLRRRLLGSVSICRRTCRTRTR
jgi:hypothetical protein